MKTKYCLPVTIRCIPLFNNGQSMDSLDLLVLSGYNDDKLGFVGDKSIAFIGFILCHMA